MKHAWLKGKLLAALPTVTDDEFYRTVILMLAHGPQGALGVVLNRPTEVAVAELFPELALEAAVPSVLFAGGPVEPDGIICLAHGSVKESERFAPVLDTWGSIDPRQPPPGGVDSVRVYRGYASWSARQLEGELDRGSWLVLDALPHDLATDQPDATVGPGPGAPGTRVRAAGPSAAGPVAQLTTTVVVRWN